MYIGVDLGTSSLKLALVNENGELIKEVTKKYHIYQPHNLWSEQDPNEWLKAMEDALIEITNQYNNIKAISFSGQMHGLVLLDKNDNVIRNCILWNDQRTYQEVDELNNNLGVDTILKETSNIMLTGVTAPKLLWVKNNELENFNKINKIMLPKDYLVYKLTNQHVTDVSDASGTLFYNVKENKYSKKIIKYLNITEQQLPKVLNSSSIVGKINNYYKQKLNLNNDVNIIIGGADQALGAIATNTLLPGQWSISLGTSGVIYTPVDKINLENEKFHTFASANNTYYYMGVTLSAANSLSWIKNILYENITYKEMFEKLDYNLQNDIIFLPYLNGERAPINDPFAQATFIGMNNNTNKEDLLKAVLEGVGFSFKQIINEFSKTQLPKINYINIIGGGAQNDKWVQIIADILGVKLQTIQNNYGPSYGAALLAIKGNNPLKSLEELTNKNIKISQTFYPNLNNYTYYNNKFLKYEKLYNAVKIYWK